MRGVDFGLLETREHNALYYGIKVLSMKKVLVIDDSRTIRTLCERIFQGLDDKVLTADSAASARAVIASESPDVVIVDYTLPDTDSYELMASLRSTTRVIALGGTYAEFDPDKARAHGAMGVLIKPFKTADFFDTIEAVMAQDIVADQAVEATPESVVPHEPVISHEQVAPIVPPISSLNKMSSSQFAKVSSSQSISAVSQAVPNSSISGVTTTSGLHSRRFNFPSSSSPSIPVAKQGDSATPKTPVPSISPAITAGQQIAIDPVVLRTEVIAAVKQMLPAIVSSYLKKLIQAEVKPQLQTWVDTRVEALIKKMIQQ